MSGKSLDELRREIDRIDDQILDLLDRRARIALEVGELKRAEGAAPVFLRPGREAQVLRRLLVREGTFPRVVVARLWREIISATLRLETPYLVSVFEPEPKVEGESYLALARAYFGVETTLKPARTEAGVLRNVRDRKASIGVLPVPVDEPPGEVRKEPWWVTLATSGNHRPKIVARLPWVRTPVDGSPGLSALAIANAPPEPTGDDLGLVALEILDQTSRNRVRAALAQIGIELTGAVGWQAASDRNLRWNLIELNGFFDDGDVRLGQFEALLGSALRRLVVLGSYPRPPAGGGLSSGSS
ncbi:MAG: chorismate mutase [Alphaproteobacteria bacterium]|nr:chorismate mutase [Alphaproteobacteria bacterium]